MFCTSSVMTIESGVAMSAGSFPGSPSMRNFTR
jgi:hypothetical protein